MYSRFRSAWVPGDLNVTSIVGLPLRSEPLTLMGQGVCSDPWVSTVRTVAASSLLKFSITVLMVIKIVARADRQGILWLYE